ncbi:MAG: prolyl oligopeptidase family serine peptidase [Anaerolineae bacterium]
MRPTILKEGRNGWPAQARPDRKLPDPWTPELLVSINRVHHHALSPQGDQVAFVWEREGNSDLWLASAAGEGWAQRLTFDRPAQNYWEDASPRWSADARWLVYASRSDIWAVPVAGGKARRLTDYQHGDSSPVFSLDGKRIYFLSGRRVFHNLCYTTLEGVWPTPLTHFEADVSDPQPAPDGETIAFVYQPQDDLNRSEICLVAAGGGDVHHLTGAPQVWDSHPRWSPDGRHIAFLSNRSGWTQLYLIDPATGGQRQLTEDAANVLDFAWSPQGDQIALVINHQGAGELYLVELESARSRALHTVPGWLSRPQWGPGGRWLTVEFESPLQPPDIYRIDLETTEVRPLTFSMPPALAAANLVMPEFIEYAGPGGNVVPAFLYRPSGASARQPCPAIVYPHGGPTSEHALEWDILVQWLVAKGYAVLAPNYRGSTGYGLPHQRALHGNWGLVDTEDMLVAADYLAGLDWVDGNRLGIYGASYGSYLAVLALARDPQYRYRCGVAKFGDCDILASWAQGDRAGREDLERQMGHPTANRAGYRAGSPVYDVANIRFPLLIMHGEQDRRVHIKQSEQLIEALKREDKTFEYVFYEGEGHGFLQKDNLLHFYATLERFLDWYLL